MNDTAARAQHYRNKAEEVLAVAASMRSDVSKQVLMSVAADYNALAEMVERSYPDSPIALAEKK